MTDPGTTVDRGRALRVALVLSDALSPSNGERRLIAHLDEDRRYDLAALWRPVAANPPAAAPLSWLERRIAPLPPLLQTPAWSARQHSVTDPAAGTRPDIVVDFSAAADGQDLPDMPRYGTWHLSSYAPGAGLAEPMSAVPATAAELSCRVAGQPARSLARAVYDTKPMALRNTEYVREKSVQLVIRELARLHRDGALPAGDPAVTPETGTARPGVPGYLGRVAGTIASRLRDKALVKAGGNPGGFALRIGHGDVDGFDPASGIDVPNPRGHYLADPFLMAHDGEVYCLFEDYDCRARIGHIGAGRLTEHGMEPLGPAHVADHHLSFPYLFRHGPDIFMLPETHQAGRLEVWRATAFPLQWTLHATALEGANLADSVLFEDAGTWWLFTGLSQDSFGDFCGELHLFRTSGPDLAWIEPHPLNPVVVGADTARGGGRVVRQGERLFRMSQDNSGGLYGWGLNVMEITSLTSEDYSERRFRHVTPDFAAGIMGCHHFDSAGGRWVLDVRWP